MIYIYDSLLCTYLFTVINFFYRIEMINKKLPISCIPCIIVPSDANDKGEINFNPLIPGDNKKVTHT